VFFYFYITKIFVMKRAVHATILLLFTLPTLYTEAQESLNVTDAAGMKQGHWLVTYENGKPRYEAYFIDNQPTGEFKRYYDNGGIYALLIYIPGNDTVKAEFYHDNGFISGKGNYVNQMREGQWEFYSQYIKDYMVLRENYSDNLREGTSIKYHWNGNLAEELIFISDTREGVWKQYYTDGVLALKSIYSGGKLNGSFEAFTVNGSPMIKGTYKNDVRDGEWLFWNNDGAFKNKIIYHDGIPENNAELISEESKLLDELEKKGGLIEDPAKTGIKW